MILRRLRAGGRVAWLAFRRFYDHGGPDRAATISYYTLLSLLPLLIFLISLGVAFLGSFEAAYENTLFLIKGVVVPLDKDALDTLRDFVVRAKGFQWPGLLLLAWTSRRIFASLISALERVFGVPGRSFATHNLLALALVLVSGVALLLSMAVTMVVSTVQGLLERFNAAGAFQFLWAVALYHVLPVVTTFGFFFLLYRFVPRRTVSNATAALGAGIASAMWELAKTAFAYYVRHIARFAGVYGALEGVIVLAVWLELSASIILYCAEIVAIVIASRQKRRIALETPLNAS